VVVVTSLRGGEEDEKEIQPDKNEEKKSTAISFCSIGDLTSTFELAMLSGAREAIFLSLLGLQANTERCVLPLSPQGDLHDLKRITEWAATKAVSTKKPQISDAESIRLATAEHALNAYAWRGSTAHNVKLIAQALLNKMRTDCTTSACVADVRTLAEKTGFTRSLVSRALRKLTGTTKDPAIPLLFTRQKTRTIKKFEDGTQDPIQHAYLYTLRDSFIGCKNETHFLSQMSTSSCLKIAPSAFPSLSLSLSLSSSPPPIKNNCLLPSSPLPFTMRFGCGEKV
jgi:hypothetical protein